MASQEDMRLSKEGKVLRKSEKEPKKQDTEKMRPLIHPNVEGILKGELTELLTFERAKLLTAKQEKVMWKKEEKVRQTERQVAQIIEKQHEAEEEEKIKALQEEYAKMVEQKRVEKIVKYKKMKLAKIAEKRDKVRQEAAIREEALSKQIANISLRKSAEAKTIEFEVVEEAQKSINPDAGPELPGEDDEGLKKSSPKKSIDPFGPKKYPIKFGPPVYPQTELPEEFEDGEWSEAEAYGYSKKFPYQKNEQIIHEGAEHENLPPYMAPISEELTEAEPNDLTETVVKKKKNQRKLSEEYDEYDIQLRKLETGRLEGLHEGLYSVDKAAVDLQRLLGKIVTREAYTPKIPPNTATTKFAYKWDGETDSQDMNTQVESNVKDFTPPWLVNKNMLDKETQVTAKDILKAYKAMMMEDVLRERNETAAKELSDEQRKIELEMQEEEEEKKKQEIEEEMIIALERKSSKRRDAMTLARPAGYKELELSVSTKGATFEAQTQVTDHEMDKEYALDRGIVLSKDEILWPSVGNFDIENAAKRIQDYIQQFWTLDPKWMYDIKPVQTISDEFRKRFIFEAKFSVPTPLHPIPLTTASVFFIFELSHYAPREDVIKVHYVVEGTRFVHTPGTLPFQDKWLWSVISDKVRVQRSIDF